MLHALADRRRSDHHPPTLPALNQLLERLRRMRPPPGAAARVVAVPSRGDQLSEEVASVLAPLDDLDRRCELVLASARADAAELEAVARSERARLIEDARREAVQMAAGRTARRQMAFEQQAQALLNDGQREAERVLAEGRERIPAFVQQIVEQIFEGAQ